MKRAVLYLRVSTIEQTTANQERELREIASRMGCEIVKVYKDHGISGAKGRDKRPAFDALCRDAAKRQFDMVMAWSVDRLGRSLQDLVVFLSELHALRIDLFLHQEGSGPIGVVTRMRSALHAQRCAGQSRRTAGCPRCIRHRHRMAGRHRGCDHGRPRIAGCHACGSAIAEGIAPAGCCASRVGAPRRRGKP